MRRSCASAQIAQYDVYIQSGRAAVPYAYLDRARALNELGRSLEAATSAQTGVNLGVPDSMQRAFLLATAQSYERAGNLTEAIRWYRNLIDVSALGGDESLALSRILALKRTLGDPTAATDQLNLLSNYPGSVEAMAELKAAKDRGEAVNPTVEGLIHYRHNDYTQAEGPFRLQILSAPTAADSALAYYYLGAILESRGDFAGALANYALVTSLDPTSLVADDALWWRGRILEDDGNRQDAQALYARIVNEYPNSSWAADAAFRQGMLAYGAGRYTEAAGLWASRLATESDTSERERLTVWGAKALLGAGDAAGARALLQPLSVSGEDDYYGIRAVSLLAGRSDQPKSVPETNLDLSPRFDWQAAETWLAARTGRSVVEGAWSVDGRWLRAQELWRVGRGSYGDAEAFDLIEAYAQDPIAMYTMSRRLAAEGRTGMSGRAGQRLLRVLNTNPNAGLPKALLSLSYPAAFGSVAEKHATAAGISPLLMLAFVRQESFFDPRAQSPVGALGLTQVLPTTARNVGSRLGLGALEEEDLLHADLNLRLGSAYMAQQLKDFGNEIFVAFAAYNAGPNAARRWRASAGADADVFLEAIEFRESRLYVEIVAENYAIYRYLYGGQAVPNLPD